MLNIKFTDVTGEVPERFYPVPAKKMIPDWHKNLTPYIGGGSYEISDDGTDNQTAKRCLPMTDAITSGYIIPLPHDISVTQTDSGPYYKWPAGLGVDLHKRGQASTHEKASRHQIPKIMNPWSIQTPRGYSTLFVSPLNREETPVSLFSGVVDTDFYFSPINFPFLLEENFEGIVSAGTPIAQVFPFKREGWKMQIEVGKSEEISKNLNSLLAVFRNGYRKMYRQEKGYY